jgi:hypothetical protein
MSGLIRALEFALLVIPALASSNTIHAVVFIAPSTNSEVKASLETLTKWTSSGVDILVDNLPVSDCNEIQSWQEKLVDGIDVIFDAMWDMEMSF